MLLSSLDAFKLSTLVVALAEMGDKTQLLTLVLASRFKQPLQICLGILVATLLNHGLAGYCGQWISLQLDPLMLRFLLGLLFFGMAFWILVPDEMDDRLPNAGRLGLFGLTVVVFFIAEIGDKTQIATVGLAAATPDLFVVVMGTTAGMLLANVPIALLGNRLAGRVPLKLTRGLAASLLALTGTALLLSEGADPDQALDTLKDLKGILSFWLTPPSQHQ